MNEKAIFRFTRDPGSALLYYGDEYVAKFGSQPRRALQGILDANKEMGDALERIANHHGFTGTCSELADAIENQITALQLMPDPEP